MARRAWPGDWAIAGYCALVSGLCIVRAPALPHWWAYALVHVAVAATVVVLVRFDRPGVIGFLREWDALALVPVLFIAAMQIVHRVHPVDYDDALIAIDRAIGGLAVLRGMVAIEQPWLTSVCKLGWVFYYFLPLVAAVPARRRGREEFARVKSALVIGWVVSYACYFAWPAVGPGYHQVEIGVPQPKWEGVSAQAKAVIHAIEAEHPRHTFPSGHVIVAALVAWYLVRMRLGAWAWVGVPLAALIAFSTLYLRYHYVIDVLVGLALAAGCAWIVSGPQRGGRIRFGGGPSDAARASQVPGPRS